MANLHFHPAPGLGELLPGYFVVPQNPIEDARGVTVTPGIGDIIGASFVVPQNPVKDFMTGNVKMIGQGDGPPRGGNIGVPPGDCGCGGSCGGCGGHGHGGMGDVSTDLTAIWTDLTAGNFSQAGTDFMTLLQEPVVAGIPVWAVGIGLFFAIQVLTSHEVTVGRKRH